MLLLALSALLVAGAPSGASLVAAQDPALDFATVFDEYWERLRTDYPYFELYGVDWQAERDHHRPLALAAENATEFTWEMARLLTVLKDAHVEYTPALEVMQGWAIPDVRVARMQGRSYLLEWGEGGAGLGPADFRDDPRAYPELVSVQGTPPGSAIEVLAAGPLGSILELRLRWPDGSESDEEIRRPATPNVPPVRLHFGREWIVSGRVGSIGYLRVKTFSPARCTLGPEGKMTPILREHLARLGDTDGLILDVQGNGGGRVAASDPFLSHFLERPSSYRWGNSGGKRRRLVPRSPRYTGQVVVLVDERSASGGEWAARILRDAGRAQVVGGPTLGAEAAVQGITAADGSMIRFGAWPMVEPGVTPFQNRGVQLDHALPLTIEAARADGYDETVERVRRARFAKALELLGAPAEHVDALVALAGHERDEGRR